MTADLSALIARLEAAEAGSRELDEAISDALCDHKFRTFVYGLPNDVGMWMYEFEGHSASSALRVTTSLDAALALAERLGCGRTYLLDNAIQTKSRALPTAHLWNDDGKHTGHARTMPLALCIAILRAKQGEGE